MVRARVDPEPADYLDAAPSADSDADTALDECQEKSRDEYPNCPSEEDAEHHNGFPYLLEKRESDHEESESDDSDLSESSSEGLSEDSSSDGDQSENADCAADAASADDGLGSSDMSTEDSEDDSEDERNEAAEDAKLPSKLIDDSIPDACVAQQYVIRIARIYRELNIYDGEMRRRYSSLALMTISLSELNLRDEIASDDETELWKLMDKYIDDLWSFVDDYSGLPSSIRDLISRLHAIEELDCWTDEQPFDEFSAVKPAEVPTLIDSIDAGCNIDSDKFIDNLSEESRSEEEIDEIVMYYTNIKIACVVIIQQFANTFPQIWAQISSRDSAIDSRAAYDAICHDQKRSEDYAIPRKRMRLLIEEVLQDTPPEFIAAGPPQMYLSPSVTRITDEAVDILQSAAEGYLCEILAGSMKIAAGGGREYLLPRDIQLCSSFRC
jgi:histone H3/H4